MWNPTIAAPRHTMWTSRCAQRLHSSPWRWPHRLPSRLGLRSAHCVGAKIVRGGRASVGLERMRFAHPQSLATWEDPLGTKPGSAPWVTLVGIAATALWTALWTASDETTGRHPLRHGTVTHCEAAEPHVNEADDDPYANLPEEDEETDCSMCRTFRQGPCRPQWRKLERCFKDHASESSSVGDACVRYFTPHQECLSRYINLYQLIDLHQTKQSLADDTEHAMRPDERDEWNDTFHPTLDWTPWLEFCRDVGPLYAQTVPIHIHPKPALWRRLPDNVEPVLIATSCTVPMYTNTRHNDKVVKFAYAIDQDGFVIGLGYNRVYADLLDQAKDRGKANDADVTVDETTHEATHEATHETTHEATSETTNKSTHETTHEATVDGTPDTMEFKLYLLPGETHTVRIVAVYFESPLTAPADKAILDAVLYTTRTAYDLQAMVQ